METETKVWDLQLKVPVSHLPTCSYCLLMLVSSASSTHKTPHRRRDGFGGERGGKVDCVLSAFSTFPAPPPPSRCSLLSEFPRLSLAPQTAPLYPPPQQVLSVARLFFLYKVLVDSFCGDRLLGAAAVRDSALCDERGRAGRGPADPAGKSAPGGPGLQQVGTALPGLLLASLQFLSFSFLYSLGGPQFPG